MMIALADSPNVIGVIIIHSSYYLGTLTIVALLALLCLLKPFSLFCLLKAFSFLLAEWPFTVQAMISQSIPLIHWSSPISPSHRAYCQKTSTNLEETLI